MTIQLSTAVRNARLDAIESTAGATAKLRIYSGAAPADAATAPSGTLLVDMTLPADYMAAASAGSKAKSGTWSGTGTAGAGAGTGTTGFAEFTLAFPSIVLDELPKLIWAGASNICSNCLKFIIFPYLSLFFCFTSKPQ